EDQMLDLLAGLLQLERGLECDPCAEGVTPERVRAGLLHRLDQLNISAGHFLDRAERDLARVDAIRLDAVDGTLTAHPPREPAQVHRTATEAWPNKDWTRGRGPEASHSRGVNSVSVARDSLRQLFNRASLVDCFFGQDLEFLINPPDQINCVEGVAS